MRSVLILLVSFGGRKNENVLKLVVLIARLCNILLTTYLDALKGICQLYLSYKNRELESWRV